MELTLEHRNKTLATIYTIVCLGIFLLIVFFIQFVTPIPPFEGSGSPGIEVNFGLTDAGMGSDYTYENPNKPNTPENNTTPTNDNGTSENNEVITSDNADNNVTVKPDKKKKQDDKKQTDQQPDKNVQDAFKNFTDNAGSDGDKNVKGNQGNPNGGDAKNYNGDNKDGNQGSGKPGLGGYGFKTNLKGRLLLTPPEKITNFTEESIIVIDIEVDMNGKVTFAEVNRSKSTNPTYDVCAKARQAAMKMKFSASPDGTVEQKGTVTFEFKLE